MRDPYPGPAANAFYDWRVVENMPGAYADWRERCPEPPERVVKMQAVVDQHRESTRLRFMMWAGLGLAVWAFAESAAIKFAGLAGTSYAAYRYVRTV